MDISALATFSVRRKMSAAGSKRKRGDFLETLFGDSTDDDSDIIRPSGTMKSSKISSSPVEAGPRATQIGAAEAPEADEPGKAEAPELVDTQIPGTPTEIQCSQTADIDLSPGSPTTSKADVPGTPSSRQELLDLLADGHSESEQSDLVLPNDDLVQALAAANDERTMADASNDRTPAAASHDRALAGGTAKEPLDDAALEAMIDPLHRIYYPMPTPSDASHWSRSKDFHTRVDLELFSCRGDPWFNDDFFRKLQPWIETSFDFDRALDLASEYIEKCVIGTCDEFKIGICESPFRRWNDKGMGYQHCKKKPWAGMALLYTSPKSKGDYLESTGNWEIAMINRWSKHPKCLNREGGGCDCPSNGSPHFGYVTIC